MLIVKEPTNESYFQKSLQDNSEAELNDVFGEVDETHKEEQKESDA